MIEAIENEMSIEEFKKKNPEYIAEMEKRIQEETEKEWNEIPKGLSARERIAYTVKKTKEEMVG